MTTERPPRRPPRGLAQHLLRWPRLVHLYETPLWRRSPFLARANGISLRNELASIGAAAEIDRARSVLDLGCGTGITSRPFAAQMPKGRVVGLDVLPTMLHYARRKARRVKLPNLAFVCATAEDLPFASESFDVVNCCGALHNFDDLERALAGIVRVLRPGGRFTVATYRKDAGRRFEGFLRRIRANSFSVPDLADRFAHAGLADFACLHEGPSWIVAVARKPSTSA